MTDRVLNTPLLFYMEISTAEIAKTRVFSDTHFHAFSKILSLTI